MKTFLITGVAGLIGSRFAAHLIEKYPDIRVVGIDDLSGGYKDNLPDNLDRFTFYQLDLKDLSKLRRVFDAEEPDFVYHMAAYAAEGLSPFIRAYNYQNNIVNTANVITECIRGHVDRLVFTSSMAVYGRGKHSTFLENDPPSPIDPYGIAKYACEMDIAVAGEQHGLNWCVIRPHNVYGRNQNIWDKYRNVLGIWMYQTLNDQPMTIYGDGSQVRAFSCVDDILDPLYVAGLSEQTNHEIINLGGNVPTTILEAANTLGKITGNSDIVHLEQRHEVAHAVPGWSKSCELLGFIHRTNLEQGLSDMWEWAKAQPQRPRKEWSAYELDTLLYPYWL